MRKLSDCVGYYVSIPVYHPETGVTLAKPEDYVSHEYAVKLASYGVDSLYVSELRYGDVMRAIAQESVKVIVYMFEYANYIYTWKEYALCKRIAKKHIYGIRKIL